MSHAGAVFFHWLQGAAFYQDLHRQAVRLLPPGAGRQWLDLGCGPGLVASLAAQHGYRTLGVDRDPAMVASARRHRPAGLDCDFVCADLNMAAQQYRADVVSAASLLYVMPDPRAALLQLWCCVKPGGYLLLVESSAQMTPARAWQLRHLAAGARRPALYLWAMVRQGRALPAELYQSPGAHSCQCQPLLGGLVQAWLLRK